MANSIFAVDGTSFVELGCVIPTFVGNPKFMHLIGGTHVNVEKCSESSSQKESGDVCVICDGGDEAINNNFTMTHAGFETMVDNVLSSLNAQE
eukprot:scaffold52711_cov63-Attheya_sp.AAC.1